MNCELHFNKIGRMASASSLLNDVVEADDDTFVSSFEL